MEFLTTLALLAVAITILWLLFTGGALPRPSPTRHAEKGPRGAAATPPLPSAPISIEGTRTKGKASATVALIEYSDFQCPWCGVYARETYPTLAKQYVDTGKLLMVFRHLPITSIHPLATKAAEAAECAGRQNKFWEMHDLLFLRQKELSSPSLVSRANALGLDAMAFSTCLEGQAASVVEADGQSARGVWASLVPRPF